MIKFTITGIESQISNKNISLNKRYFQSGNWKIKNNVLK